MVIVFDLKLMRPACPILQSAMGGDLHATTLFPGETWLIDVTPGMQRYELTELQLKQLAGRVRRATGKPCS